MADETFGCPNCGATLHSGTPRCGRCGLRLSGGEAGRLWQIDQELARLGEERTALVAALLRPQGSTATMPLGPLGPPAVPRVRRTLSGQQVLLGLGALLLLSAAAFFLVIVWIVVGLLGQAAIMLALTLGTAGGARWATLRRLPAAAETAAALTTGLLLIDAWAAHALGLAGLDGLALDRYGIGATMVLLVALVAADRWVPRARAGASLRPVLVYRPAATAMAALTPWCVLSASGVHADARLAGLEAVALVDLLVAGAAHRWLQAPRPWLTEGPPLAAAAIAVAAFVADGLALGYDPGRGIADRWVAAALLALGLGAGALLSGRVRRGPSARVVLGLGAVLVVGIPLMDAPAGVLVGISAIAAAAGSLHGRWAGVAAGIVTGGYVAVALLRGTALASLHQLSGGLPVTSPPVDSRDVAVMLLPALAALALALYSVARTHAAGWVSAAQLAVLVTAVTALLASPAGAWTAVTTTLAVAEVGLATYRGRTHPDAPTRIVEELALIAAVPYAVIAVGSAASVSSERAAAVLVVLGVAVLVSAGRPGRLWLGYVGSLLVSGGIDTWLGVTNVDVIEAYTLPLAAMLAVLGAVQWRRDPTLPTASTLGPALSVGLLPSTLGAISDGDALRLAVVTALAALAVWAGLMRLWRAPVTVGAAALVVVAVTQGGPLIAYVPGWVTLALAGALLLAVGVAWERAVLAGRRAHAWYGTLH